MSDIIDIDYINEQMVCKPNEECRAVIIELRTDCSFSGNYLSYMEFPSLGSAQKAKGFIDEYVDCVNQTMIIEGDIKNIS